MRSLFSVLGLVVLGGCQAESDYLTVEGLAPTVLDEAFGADVDATYPSLRAPIFLQRTGSMNPGATVTFRVTGLSPGETTKLAVSTTGLGAGPCPASLGGQCLGLLSPRVLASPIADARGTARVNVKLGAAVPLGLQIHTQAVAIRGVGGALTEVSDARTDEVVSEVTDDFVHFPAAADLLFVIDDSCSMFEEQQALTDGFGSMIEAVLDLGLDFHVGVVSTDMTDANKSGKLQPDDGGGLWIDPSDSNPALTFEEMASLGTVGSATEKGLQAVTESLDTFGTTHNNGFRRVTAQYAVVVVSDEEDQSPGAGTVYSDRIAQEAFYAGDVTFTSIVTPVGNCNTGSTVGNRYLAATAALGGITESICANDYSYALTDLAASLFTSVPYELSSTPFDSAAISVVADEGSGPVVLDSSDFVYDTATNTIRFTSSYAPQAGIDLHISYEPL